MSCCRANLRDLLIQLLATNMNIYEKLFDWKFIGSKMRNIDYFVCEYSIIFYHKSINLCCNRFWSNNRKYYLHYKIVYEGQNEKNWKQTDQFGNNWSDSNVETSFLDIHLEGFLILTDEPLQGHMNIHTSTFP